MWMLCSFEPDHVDLQVSRSEHYCTIYQSNTGVQCNRIQILQRARRPVTLAVHGLLMGQMVGRHREPRGRAAGGAGRTSQLQGAAVSGCWGG